MNSFIHVSVISVYQSSRYSVCRRIIIALILTLAKDFCRSVTQSCLTLRPHGLQHTGLSCSSPSPGVCANLFFTFVPLFYFLDSLYKWDHTVFIFSMSNLFHLAQYPKGPCMLSQMVRFHSLLWLSNISLYMYIHHGSQFLNQVSNLCHLQWKCRILSIGPPGKSLLALSLWLEKNTWEALSIVVGTLYVDT